MKPCDYFANSACVDGRCPNAQYEMADAAYDNAGLAEDMGYERTTCGKCGYNKATTCDDCMFQYTEGHCPNYDKATIKCHTCGKEILFKNAINVMGTSFCSECAPGAEEIAADITRSVIGM